MFGFKSSTIKVDWSLYGGAEQTGPAAACSSSSAAPARQGSMQSPTSFASTSMSASSSSAGSTAGQSRSASPTFSSPDDTNTSFTSEDIDDNDDDDYGTGALDKAPASARKEADSRMLAKDGLPWLPKIEPQDQSDFLWMHTEEPHRSRRMAILKAHPEVRRLMGYEPLTKYVSGSVTLLQLGLAMLVSHLGWHPLSWKMLALAYIVGGTANQNTFLAIHEITHNLAFKGIRANKAWAIAVNAAIGVPYAMAFKPYHLEHHKYLGEDGTDTDLPTKLEQILLKNVLGKTFFATFQIFFYALRPGFVRAQRPTVWHLANVVAILTCDAVLVRYFGWTALLYLLFSSFFAGSLHPCAAHFIAEHYMFENIQQETWSYYGPLNILAYNVGYHNEHHDFPSVPWTRLPALRKLAPEFYDCLPHHTSWPMVTLQFILGSDSGLFARIKRANRDAQRSAAAAAAKAK
ncbi:hypothetical protein BCV70DRAFT_198464 [Testicularia cyperi]|uniref:sphingolipid 4-desaturase n=1 Tax=Testicularia cyperi TaxID=1882483 RepID=A0A317XV67_9BASI|nr:hypothetical protein BCV70DRAFT_198464 [Testicularia cyperi]